MADEKKLKVKLNAETSLFFAQLIDKGLASYEHDPCLEEGEVHASVTKDAKGKHMLKVHSLSFIIFAADE